MVPQATLEGRVMRFRALSGEERWSDYAFSPASDELATPWRKFMAEWHMGDGGQRLRRVDVVLPGGLLLADAPAGETVASVFRPGAPTGEARAEPARP